MKFPGFNLFTQCKLDVAAAKNGLFRACDNNLQATVKVKDLIQNSGHKVVCRMVGPEDLVKNQ